MLKRMYKLVYLICAHPFLFFALVTLTKHRFKYIFHTDLRFVQKQQSSYSLQISCIPGEWQPHCPL